MFLTQWLSRIEFQRHPNERIYRDEAKTASWEAVIVRILVFHGHQPMTHGWFERRPKMVLKSGKEVVDKYQV